MAQLTVRNVDDEIVRALKVRAGQHGRSAEAELREILRDTLIRPKPKMSFEEALASMPEGLTDADLARPRTSARRVDLG